MSVAISDFNFILTFPDHSTNAFSSRIPESKFERTKVYLSPTFFLTAAPLIPGFTPSSSYISCTVTVLVIPFPVVNSSLIYTSMSGLFVPGSIFDDTKYLSVISNT